MHPHAGPELCSLLRRAEQSIVGTAYCFDYPDGVSALTHCRRPGSAVEIRVILDEGQQRKPSCSQQKARVNTLREWGVQFRVYSPPDRGRHAVMHAKSWCIDGSILVGGSPNFTSNGLEKSEELMFVSEVDPGEEAVTDYLEWFEGLWSRSQELPLEGSA